MTMLSGNLIPTTIALDCIRGSIAFFIFLLEKCGISARGNLIPTAITIYPTLVSHTIFVFVLKASCMSSQQYTSTNPPS